MIDTLSGYVADIGWGLQVPPTGRGNKSDKHVVYDRSAPVKIWHQLIYKIDKVLVWCFYQNQIIPR